MRHLTKWKEDSSISLIGHKVSFPASILPSFRSLAPIHPPVHPQDAARVVLPGPFLRWRHSPLSSLQCLALWLRVKVKMALQPPACTSCLPLRPHLLLPPAASLDPHPRPPESSCPGPLYSVALPTLQLPPWPGSNVPCPWLNTAGCSSLSSFLCRTNHPLMWPIFHLFTYHHHIFLPLKCILHEDRELLALLSALLVPEPRTLLT